MNVSVEIKCPYCRDGYKPKVRKVFKPWMALHWICEEGMTSAYRCDSWDDEMRHVTEPLGYSQFAWLPVRCRNGKVRWLRWVERHADGTYSLDRAG